MKQMRPNWFQSLLLVYLAFVFGFWVTLHVNGWTDTVYNQIYSLLFSLIPLIGGLIAVFGSRLWGGLKSHVGRAVFFIGLGIFFWGAGSMDWSYYNLVLHVEAPYPSLADFGFAPSIFFYGLGAIYLSQATGAKFGLRNKFAKIFVTVAPLIILVASYYVLVTVARGGVLVPDGETPLKVILDLAYPLGDFVGLTISIIVSGLSFRYLGGRYLADIISILSGLAMMFVADTVFSYTTTVGTFYNGDFGDLLLTIGLFLLAYGVLGFCKLRESAATPERV
jgi:hypothetical protein